MGACDSSAMAASVRGVGVIEDISSAGTGPTRTPTGEYRWRIAMVFTLEGHRRFGHCAADAAAHCDLAFG